uniref:Uncharacterized protein n=1 Tax=Rhizophora mucronata TaxID=61149 RepID=A0A2P2K4X2_RHIMU
MHFSFLVSTKRTETLEIGHPSMLGQLFDASKVMQMSHASIIFFSVKESCFSGSSNSISLDLRMSLIYAKRVGLKITANLQNPSKVRNSSSGCCFLW